MKTKLFALVFGLVGIIQLYAEAVGHIPLRNFSKPLVVILLLVWLYRATDLRGRFHKRIFTGLVFSLIGDVFLMLQANNTSFFNYGLIAFLFCHIFYIRAFTLDHKSNPNV